MKWNGKKVAVTGAGGFIGSHLSEALVRAGAEVTAVVRYNSAGSWGWLDSSEAKDNIRAVACDICDGDSVKKAMSGCEMVFHLAALIAIPYSYFAPESYVRTNISGTLNILQAARELEVERVIHTSTSEVYGTAHYVPIDEMHPLQGQSPYAASKIGADKLVESFVLSYGVPVVSVRPFNTFGPRQSMRAVIPTIITQCVRGNDVHLGNLTPTRDMNFVDNTVDGFVAAAAAEGCLGGVFNLGSGREISIGDLARVIIKMSGRKVEVRAESERVRPASSEVDRLLADSQAARNALGWRPRVELEEGLMRTVEWIEENVDIYRSDVYAV